VRYLTLSEVITLHSRLIASTGGSDGIGRLPGLESAIALPRQTFGGADLYPGLAEKAAVLGFALIKNHPFVDGNKRIGHAALETFLVLNGHELVATTEEGEATILAVAAGELSQDQFLEWVRAHLKPLQP
jgi:death on curing protein